MKVVYLSQREREGPIAKQWEGEGVRRWSAKPINRSCGAIESAERREPERAAGGWTGPSLVLRAFAAQTMPLAWFAVASQRRGLTPSSSHAVRRGPLLLPMGEGKAPP